MRISDWSSDVCSSDLNIGAVLRSAAAFDAAAIITQDRHSPPESGVIARSASGAPETVPWVRVVNLSRALEEIAEAQYWTIGLTGDAATTMGETLADRKVAHALGPEGHGMSHTDMEPEDVLAENAKCDRKGQGGPGPGEPVGRGI